MGITLAERDGGQGGSLMDAVIAIEHIAAVCPRSADVVQFGSFEADPAPSPLKIRHIRKSRRARFLPDLLAGRMVMSLGMTEPEAGSAATPT